MTKQANDHHVFWLEIDQTSQNMEIGKEKRENKEG